MGPQTRKVVLALHAERVVEVDVARLFVHLRGEGGPGHVASRAQRRPRTEVEVYSNTAGAGVDRAPFVQGAHAALDAPRRAAAAAAVTAAEGVLLRKEVAADRVGRNVWEYHVVIGRRTPYDIAHGTAAVSRLAPHGTAVAQAPV